MMTFGLNPSDFQTLATNVIEPLKRAGFKLYVFGSRATGKHHSFSDIDILIESSKKIDKAIFYHVKETIEEARFPIKVDFVFAEDLAHSYAAQVHNEKTAI